MLPHSTPISQGNGKLFPTRRRDGREAEGGGLLNLPRPCRFNLPNSLHPGVSALKWGDSASFGRICSPLRSPDLLDYVETNGTALLE